MIRVFLIMTLNSIITQNEIVYNPDTQILFLAKSQQTTLCSFTTTPPFREPHLNQQDPNLT